MAAWEVASVFVAMASADDVARADGLMQAGNKKATSSGGFLSGLMGNSQSKFEDAYNMFNEAANLYKINKRFDKSAEAYGKAADMQLKLDSPHEAARCYVDASNMLKKTNPKEAADALLQAAAIMQRGGKLAMAAKHINSAAELQETQLADLESALASYERAAEMYDLEDSQTAGGKCLIKVAHINAQLDRFERATELFEQVAKAMVDNHLLKWSAKEYFLKAGLCRMCLGDITGARVYAEQYAEIATGFRDSREARLLMDLITACEGEDVDQYTGVLQAYDSVTPLDQWMTTILLKIKKSIKQEDELQ